MVLIDSANVTGSRLQVDRGRARRCGKGDRPNTDNICSLSEHEAIAVDVVWVKIAECCPVCHGPPAGDADCRRLICLADAHAESLARVAASPRRQIDKPLAGE
jgi:hypothetical protein